MRKLLFALLLALAAICSAPAFAEKVVVLEVNGVIGPALADYFQRGMSQAQDEDASLVVLRMDTPGGLDTAMREFIRTIIRSPIPVATYVAPGGARAASAGTYILYASHIAAMAPGTNLGAATPVQVGGMPGAPEPERSPKDSSPDAGEEESDASEPSGAMERKMVNDAVAYLRSLAQMRGRDADWAEKAVREAASLPAQVALERGVIDLVATSLDDLLARIHGREVVLQSGPVTLQTANAEVVVIEPDWRSRFLTVISNPNIAYILMLIGIYGLIFELANPGGMVAGVLGGICLLLALFAFQALPINYAGLALMLLGLVFMAAEVLVPSFGALGLGGVVAFVIGSIMLMDEPTAGMDISMGLIAGFAVISLALCVGVVTMAVRAHGRPSTAGGDAMIGREGTALEDFDDLGRVMVQGEVWQARTDAPVKKGQTVRVEVRDGLRLRVGPIRKTDEE